MDRLKNPNDAASDKWRLVIDSELELFTSKVNDFEMAGFGMDGTIGPRSGPNSMLNIQGDTITFDPMTFTFVVDEDFSNYIEVVKRLFQNATDDPYFDVSVGLVGNTNKDLGINFTYMNSRVSNISGVSRDTNASIKTLTCTATFIFEGLKITKEGVVVLDSTANQNLFFG